MSTILGTPVSPFVRKTMLAHAFKDIDFQLNAVLPGSDDEEFQKASPLGKVPAYKTDSGVLFADSSVIIAYLEKTSPESPLYPENADNFARALWIEEYADTKLSEVCNALFFEKIIGPTYFGHTTDNERVEKVIGQLIPAAYDYLESQLVLGEWFIDNSLSVADLAVGSMIVGPYHAKYTIDTNRHPKLADFFKRFMQLDFVAAQLDQESSILFANES